MRFSYKYLLEYYIIYWSLKKIYNLLMDCMKKNCILFQILICNVKEFWWEEKRCYEILSIHWFVSSYTSPPIDRDKWDGRVTSTFLAIVATCSGIGYLHLPILLLVNRNKWFFNLSLVQSINTCSIISKKLICKFLF